MRKVCSVILACVMVFALTGCKKKEEPVETPTPSMAATEITAPTADTDGRDPLNGSEQASEYKPIIVMMDNSPQARPQYGISSADIVYECQVEGRMTRLMAVYNSVIPTRCEAVRSARIYFIAKAGEYDPVYVHYGGTNGEGHEANIYDYLDNNGGVFQKRVDGLSQHYGTLSRDSGRKAPHNAMADLEKIRNEVYDFEPKVRKFVFDPEATLPGDETAEYISIPFDTGTSHTEYAYDQEKDVYLRSQGGKAFMDGNNNEQVTVKNIVIEMAQYTPLPGTQKADVIGEGEATFFIGGKMAKGTWKKESIEDATQYALQDGTPVTFRPGNTWFHVVPLDVEVTTK